jgi:hypothetical protein
MQTDAPLKPPLPTWLTRTMASAYSGWCQAALPHRRLPDDKEWQIRSDHVNMLVQPGLRTSNFGDAEKIGVPYGSRARLIMFYVQSEALRTSSREVRLGRSMNQWLIRMGVPVGGKSMNAIKDQASLLIPGFEGYSAGVLIGFKKTI